MSAPGVFCVTISVPSIITFLAVFAVIVACVCLRNYQDEFIRLKKDVRRLEAEAETSCHAEERARFQRDSVTKSLDECVNELAAIRENKIYLEEVLQEATNLAIAYEMEPANPKAKNVLSRAKLEAVIRVIDAVDLYFLHKTGRVPRNEQDVELIELPVSHLDDWAAQFGAQKSTAELEAQATQPGDIVLGGKAPLRSLMNLGA